MKEYLLPLLLFVIQGILSSFGRQIGDSLDIKEKITKIKEKTTKTTAIVLKWFKKK